MGRKNNSFITLLDLSHLTAGVWLINVAPVHVKPLQIITHTKPLVALRTKNALAPRFFQNVKPHACMIASLDNTQHFTRLFFFFFGQSILTHAIA